MQPKPSPATPHDVGGHEPPWNTPISCQIDAFPHHRDNRSKFLWHVIWVWKGRKVYQIPEPYILTRWTKKSYRPIVYDENGKVIEDFDEVDVRKIEMSNVWSEIYKTVGLLDSGELKNMKEFSKLLKQFRETVVGAVEKKSKNKEIEDLLGCKAPQEIDILPPHKEKNKGSGKRQMSSKQKAVRKTEKRKRRCGNCKRWVNHNSRTCNLPFVEDLPSDDDERETDDEEEESSDA
ncbi:hypothetical protein KSS87_002707 [Heliosperma pusillum]|nr:hypothetical protein KSS87_002707 [Heliosperma pusillum]